MHPITQPTDICLLNKPVDYYYFVAQGKTSIPGVDDQEELTITDVSASPNTANPTVLDVLL